MLPMYRRRNSPPGLLTAAAAAAALTAAAAGALTAAAATAGGIGKVIQSTAGVAAGIGNEIRKLDPGTAPCGPVVARIASVAGIAGVAGVTGIAGHKKSSSRRCAGAKLLYAILCGRRALVTGEFPVRSVHPWSGFPVGDEHLPCRSRHL